MTVSRPGDYEPFTDFQLGMKKEFSWRDDDDWREAYVHRLVATIWKLEEKHAGS